MSNRKRFKDSKENIEKDKPFADFIPTIHIGRLQNIGVFNRRVSPLGYALKIQDSNKKFYKLRVAPSSDVAEKQEHLIRLVLQFFPKFYGRDRNYLLFEFLKGRILTKNENLDIIYKIGEMCGEANKFKSNEKEEIVDYFYKVTKFIFDRKIISAENYSKILGIYEKLIQKIEYDIVLEISDIQMHNFMVLLRRT